MNYLFLRGLARHQGHWYDFEKKFQTEVNQILTIDFPGNGEFENLDSPLEISIITEFTRKKFLERKANNSPWIVVAISMGGMVALDWFSKYPDDFQKIFIINSSSKDAVMPWQRFSLKTFLQLPYLIFSNQKTKEKKILDITLNIAQSKDQILEKALNFKFRPTSKVNFLRQLMCAARFKLPRVLNTQNKLIFIVSKNDQLVSSLAGNYMAHQLNSKIILNDHAGHDLPLDDGNWLFSKILENS